MIAYNKTSLDNLHIQQQAEEEHNNSNLSDAELKAVKQKYPVNFYTSSIFIRVGLFILTVIIALFSYGLLSLMISSSSAIGSFGWPLFLGLATYTALEVAVIGNKHYHSGVAEALLYMAAGLLSGSFIWMVHTIDKDYTHENYFSICIFYFILSTYLTLRFLDNLMSAIAALSFLAIIFFGWKSIGYFGVTTLPFIMMAASAFLCLIIPQLKRNTLVVYYTSCLYLLRIVGLVMLYLAGNYYVVRELGNQITNAAPGTPLPFGSIFWAWTVLLPFLYIGLGIRKKDALLLRIGLLLISGTVFTFRNYYHVLPIELALTIGGSILIMVAYFIIRYLKTPQHGFTSADPGKKNLMDHLNIEALIVGQTFSHSPDAPVVPDSRFGGGDAGGGGSSGSF